MNNYNEWAYRLLCGWHGRHAKLKEQKDEKRRNHVRMPVASIYSLVAGFDSGRLCPPPPPCCCFILLLLFLFFFAAFDFLFPPSSQFLHSLLEWTGSLVPLHHHHRQHRALYYSRKWIEGPEYVECQTFSLSSGFAKGWVEIEGGEDK